MKAFARICELLDRAAIAVVAAALSGIFLITTGNAVLRYCLGINLLWAYDLLRVLFLFFIFFGIPIVYKRKNHARYTFMDTKITGTASVVLHEIIHVISAMVFLVMTLESAKLAANTWAQIMPASQVRAMWLYVPLALGGAICLVQTAYFIVEELAGDGSDAPAGGSGEAAS